MFSNLRSFIKNKILSRYFNELIDHGQFLEKRSTHKDKLKTEYEFFQNLPSGLEIYFPRVQGFGEQPLYSHYLIQKISAQDASFLFLDKNGQDASILQALKKIQVFLSLCPKKVVSSETYHNTFVREFCLKNIERLKLIKDLPQSRSLDLLCQSFSYKNLDEFVNQMNAAIEKALKGEGDHALYFSHGDLCFSNMIIKNDQLYLIDPKGAASPDDNYRTIHYDLAKISQCLHGHYDLINHELFEIESNKKIIFNRTPQTSDSQTYFSELVHSFGTNLSTIRLIEASLFYSLLPFHQESEKKIFGFLINALTIFRGLN